MLKLLKYEWKACARTCLPLYGAIILVALINHLLYSEAVPDLLFGIPAAIMSMLYAVIFAAVFVATAVILVQRFYKSLLGGEGYLMFSPAGFGHAAHFQQGDHCRCDVLSELPCGVSEHPPVIARHKSCGIFFL